MATLQAATTSTGATVEDPDAFQSLLERYSIEPLNYEVSDENELVIWGYADLNVYAIPEDDEEEKYLATEQFLQELASLLTDGERFDIQTAGFTKCRFPVLAKRYVLEDGEVKKATLSDPSPINPESPA